MRSDTGPKTVRLRDYQRPAYWLDTTELTIRIKDTATEVDARLVMRINREDYDSPQPLVLQGSGLTVQSVHIDGAEITDLHWTGENLELPPVDRDSFVVETSVEIDPAGNTSLEGLYRSGGMYCTQCEAEGFRKITLFPDRPDVLSVFTTRIEAPAAYPQLLANGNLVSSGELPDNRHFAVWHDPYPKPSYLFAMVAGDLVTEHDEFVTQSGRTVALRLYTEAHNAHKTRFALESLKRAMRWDEQTYGREYDLDCFMIVAVDHFNMGAMENKGLNIFNSACVLADERSTTDGQFETIEAIVAHEYFHNWSGNRVTCRDWFQLSLKEGFTVFRDSEFTADMHARAVKRMDDVTMLRTAQFPEDAGPMAHPIRPDSYMEINNFYTVTVYEKGAEVVRMLHTLLGAERFRRGADLYFDRFDGQAVTTEDFVQCMSEASGFDLEQFQHWYDQAGTPRVDVTANYDADDQTLRLHFEQSCPATPGQPRKPAFHIPVKLGLIGRDSGMPHRIVTDDAGYDPVTGVFSLRDESATLVLRDVSEPVVPSLLRDFSAPVVCRFPYTDDELTLLSRADDNSFNRWDAMQTLATRAILARVRGEDDADARARSLKSAMSAVLRDDLVDNAVKARILQLPTQAYLAEQFRPVDPLVLDDCHLTLRRWLAGELLDQWQQIFEQTRPDRPYAFSHEQNARRSLHLKALEALVLASENGWQEAESLFRNADNMTEQSGALNLWSSVVNTEWHGAMDAFYDQWKSDAQVVEKWLAIRASARGVRVEDIRQLTEHDAFDWGNPNRIRSVIGGFAMRNPAAFHASDGAGYRYLADVILRLDRTNPQIAARLCTPFTQWRRYVDSVQSQMKSELQRLIETPDLSAGVYEVVSKSLAEQQGS